MVDDPAGLGATIVVAQARQSWPESVGSVATKGTDEAGLQGEPIDIQGGFVNFRVG